jgi:hypothetical protein
LGSSHPSALRCAGILGSESRHVVQRRSTSDRDSISHCNETGRNSKDTSWIISSARIAELSGSAPRELERAAGTVHGSSCFPLNRSAWVRTGCEPWRRRGSFHEEEATTQHGGVVGRSCPRVSPGHAGRQIRRLRPERRAVGTRLGGSSPRAGPRRASTTWRARSEQARSVPAA